MPRVYLQSTADEDPLGLGRRLYRIFLLSILFAVLWVKGYLWTAFIIALLLYAYEIVIRAALAGQAIEIPDDEPAPRRGNRRWKWKPEEPT